MTMLDDFRNAVEDFGWIGGLVISGSVFAPLIAAGSGLAPPWPENLEFVGMVAILVSLILVFQFLPRRKGRYRLFLALSAIGLVISMATQFVLHLRFVKALPGTDTEAILGCGWTGELQAVARAEPTIDASAQCPGEYHKLLEMAENDPLQVWTSSSIDNIALLLSASWVLMFALFTVVLAAFVIFNSRQKSQRANREVAAQAAE
ncbi:hypothetical protein [Qipengyuania mesophila]|uniref:hypothetical protein n=1 Tax=Qipengyuania mesophila TaxID=2867246 RepID=UPI0035116971